MILSPILAIDQQKVEHDLAFVMTCFREVLDEAGERELAACLPWIDASCPPPEGVPRERLLHAYSIAFHLLSMVEQNAAIQQQRQTESRHGLAAMQALWGQCVRQTLDAGVTPQLAVEGGEMDAVLGFVRAGLGVAVVPRMVATRSGRGLRVTPLARPGLHRTIALAHRSDVAPPRAARELQRMLLER